MKKMLNIESRIESLRLVEKFVDDVSNELKLSNEIYGNLLIAVLEAANNAIVHGNKLDESKKVKIELLKEKDRLVIIVKDQGPGFDYNNIPDPTAPENIEKITGRGIFLMQKLSDDIEFSENGTVVKLIFKT